MKAIERIKEFLFGVEVVSVEDAVRAFDRAIYCADKDEDGMLSIRELIGIFKEVCYGKE